MAHPANAVLMAAALKAQARELGKESGNGSELRKNF
jgi:hypothetical protein